MQYIARKLDLMKILSSKSLFLFGPRQTGKSSFIKNQIAKEDIALFWTLLDGSGNLRTASSSLTKSRNARSFWTRCTSS